MPYADPEKKAEWDRTHRRERSEAAFAASAYASRQISILKGLGVRHTPEEWRELATALKVGFRELPTDRDTPPPTP